MDLLSRLYLPTTFILKVILSKAQATGVKRDWVLRVMEGVSPDDLIAMKVAVSVGKAAIEAAPPKSDNETDKAYQV